MVFEHKAFLKEMTTRPGVYRMVDADGAVIYVGKANNLRARLRSYFNKQVSPKTRKLVSQIADIKTVVTANEHEALILEQNLIKRFRPKYNVLLRDDKSYPFICVDKHHDFPGVTIQYKRKQQGDRYHYYGPLTAREKARQFLDQVYRLYKVRNCSDSMFRHRTRPCLQYQINRCSAPCVGYVSQEEYQATIDEIQCLLKGESDGLRTLYHDRMREAAEGERYEEAARWRDHLQDITGILHQQAVATQGGDCDVFVLRVVGDHCLLLVHNYREGELIDQHSYKQKLAVEADAVQLFEQLLMQYYQMRGVSPGLREVLVSSPLAGAGLELFLREQVGRRVVVKSRVQGERLAKLNLALENAERHLEAMLQSQQGRESVLGEAQAQLGLDRLPLHVECFDNSHTQGDEMVASCVVFKHGVADKAAYRHFTLRGIGPGDDYAGMQQVLERRIAQLRAEGTPLPDLILIDGGKGQLSSARAILASLGCEDTALIGIAKGPRRKAGEEVLWLSSEESLSLPAHSSLLRWLQTIRDEAHRFAIEHHRRRRGKKVLQGSLEAIEGLGAQKRKQLLTHFGGLQRLKGASLEELKQVEGIGPVMAERVYRALHGR